MHPSTVLRMCHSTKRTQASYTCIITPRNCSHSWTLHFTALVILVLQKCHSYSALALHFITVKFLSETLVQEVWPPKQQPVLYRTHLFIFPDTSVSFMKHSIFRGMSVLFELISFFSFSHSWYRRRRARTFAFGSSLYFAFISAQK